VGENISRHVRFYHSISKTTTTFTFNFSPFFYFGFIKWHLLLLYKLICLCLFTFGSVFYFCVPFGVVFYFQYFTIIHVIQFMWYATSSRKYLHANKQTCSEMSILCLGLSLSLVGSFMCMMIYVLVYIKHTKCI
jgi:hypothetical protein